MRSVPLLVTLLVAGAAACVDVDDADTGTATDTEAAALAVGLPPWPLPPIVPAPLCVNGNAFGGMQNVAGITCQANPAGTNLCCDTRPNQRYPGGLTCVIGRNRPPPWGECVPVVVAPPPVVVAEPVAEEAPAAP